jgi:hypothetical protein
MTELFFEFIAVGYCLALCVLPLGVWHGRLFKKSGFWFCKMTFWGLAFFKDIQRKINYVRERIDSPD